MIFLEDPPGFRLTGSLEDLACRILHRVSPLVGRVVEHVPAKVRVVGRPDRAGQLLPNRLLSPPVSVAGGMFYARQAPFGELLQEGLPGSSVSLSAV